MKFSLPLLFALSLAAHLSSENVTANDIEVDQSLLSDTSIGIQNGSDVIITKPGLLDVFLGGEDLVLEVCSMNCSGE